MKVLGLILLLLLAARPGVAQERVTEVQELPRERAEELLAFVNDASTIVSSGRARLPAGAVIRGNVASLGGPYVLGGRVEGSLVVVNGDLSFEPGAEVTGDVTVAGGTLQGEEDATISGTLTVHSPALPYTRSGEKLVYRPAAPTAEDFFRSQLPFGTARFTLRAASNYSRVEGLPVLFGPLFESSGSNPFAIEVFGIWRSTSGLALNRNEMGYRVQVEQSLGGSRELALGASLRSEHVPIEDWGLSNVEASMATFLLRRDFRDYYERSGWSAFFRYAPMGSPLTLRAEFREEDHAFAPIRNPWTLGDEDAGWRPQPIVSEGEIRSVGASLRFDSRNDVTAPSHGWLADFRVRRGVGGNLRHPLHTPPLPDATPERPDSDFTTALIDARRYFRLGPATRMSVRGLAAGALTERPLPSQLQHSVGGEGSLPGHPRFSGDCGARAETRLHPTDGSPAYAAYGCDRVALLQMEYQRTFGFGWLPLPDEWHDPAEEWDWAPFFDFRPRWSVFFNAGRGWALDGPLPHDLPRVSSPTLTDAGFGVFLGSIGLYWAVPLTQRDRGVNFFVRLHHRF